jgi:hypothetical protein
LYSHFLLKGCDFTANSASEVRIESSGWGFLNPRKRTSPSSGVSSLLNRCLLLFLPVSWNARTGMSTVRPTQTFRCHNTAY